ncbi:ribosomal protein S18-alanine N-acetyltransferase [Leeia oryzae]|uniref:ribosomal protein S18-alanine N-acetyltransferase n=1 Tax=Leeia oryzae TaxID=356662 RepID=UPI00036E121B|nr:ribosomal protein S18-alanine N-acetyltransferase [Leeia oryzae]
MKLQKLTDRWLDNLIELDAAASEWPWLRTQYLGSFEHHDAVYGWVDRDTLCGLAVVQYVLDEANLLNFAIAAEYQGQGFGKHWMQCVIQEARDKHASQTMFLEVRAGNAAAIKLYTRSGFVQTGLRKAYYPARNGREDAICMSLIMSDNLVTLEPAHG